MKKLLLLFATVLSTMGAILPPSTKSHIYTTGTLAQVNGQVRALATNDSAFTNLGANAISAGSVVSGSLNVSGNANVGTLDVNGAATFLDQVGIGGAVIPASGLAVDGLMAVFGSSGTTYGIGNGLEVVGGNLRVNGMEGTGPTILRAYDSAGNLIAEINGGTNRGFWVTNIFALTGVGLNTNGTIYLKGIHSHSNNTPVAALAVDANGLTTLAPLASGSGGSGSGTNWLTDANGNGYAIEVFKISGSSAAMIEFTSATTTNGGNGGISNTIAAGNLFAVNGNSRFLGNIGISQPFTDQIGGVDLDSTTTGLSIHSTAFGGIGLFAHTNGNFGLYTNSPKAALDIVGGLKVNGTGQITGTLTVNGAADFLSTLDVAQQGNDTAPSLRNDSDTDTGIVWNNGGLSKVGLTVNGLNQLGVNDLGAFVRLGNTFNAATQSVGGVMLSVTNSVTVTNSATETSMFGVSYWGRTNNVSTAFWTNGRTVLITFSGITSAPLTPDSLVFKVYVGANSVSFPDASGALLANAENSPFNGEVRLVQTTSTNLFVSGKIDFAQAAGIADKTVRVRADVMVPNNGAIDLTAKWGAAATAESITVDPTALIQVLR